MMLIDTHVHLDQIESVERVIQTALQAEIRVIIAVGMDNASNNKILELADQFAGMVYPAIGYHPWSIEADEVEDTSTGTVDVSKKKYGVDFIGTRAQIDF